MTARPLSPETRDLTAVDRARLALALLRPLVDAAQTDAAGAVVAHALCVGEARQAGAPDDICAGEEDAKRAARWRLYRLVGAAADLESWLDADRSFMTPAEGTEATTCAAG